MSCRKIENHQPYLLQRGCTPSAILTAERLYTISHILSSAFYWVTVTINTPTCLMMLTTLYDLKHMHRLTYITPVLVNLINTEELDKIYLWRQNLISLKIFVFKVVHEVP